MRLSFKRKQILSIVVTAFIFCEGCKKDVPIQTSPKKEIVNKLITGNNCTNFHRLIEGFKMEDLWSVKQTSDDGYILCGSTSTIAESENDILLIKTDCFGDTEWIKTISNDYSDVGYDIVQTSTGEYILTTNYTISPSNYPIVPLQGQLIKLSIAGNIIWRKAYSFGNSTRFVKIKEHVNGSFIICGYDDYDGGFVFNIDAFGTEIWRNKFGQNIFLYDISINSNKNLVVCGSIVINQQNDIYIAELNIMGDTIWTKSLDKGNITNEANSILSINNNDIIISGYNRASGTNLPGFAMKLSPTGQETWYRSFEPNSIGEVNNIVTTHDNELMAVGLKSNSLSFIKINLISGTIIWEKIKPINPIVRSMQLTSDDGFILVGNQFVSLNNRDGLILKTDSNAN